jgi:hypothetical protein
MIGFDTIIETDMMTKAGVSRLMRRINRETLEEHIDQALPKHFEQVPETSPGGGGYRYKRRRRAYTREKLEEFGHSRPNVKEGHFRTAVLSTAKVTATQHRARMVARGTPKHPVDKFQTQEVANLSAKERRTYVRNNARKYRKLSQTPEFRRKRRVGGGRK